MKCGWESCLFCFGGDTQWKIQVCFDVSNLGGELVYIFVVFLFSCFYFFHTCVYAFCLVFQEIYRLIQLSYCLHLQLMDNSQVEFVVMGILLYWVVLVFEHFVLYESFVTNYQRGSLLGSKCLEQLANREHKLVQIQIFESIGFIRQCSMCFKSRFKNIQAAGRRLHILSGSID